VLSYSVYILFSEKDHLLYIGYTADLNSRKQKHDNGGVKSTASRRPLLLIYCEYYLFESDAKRRELYFKTSMGKKAIKLMLTDTLVKLGYKAGMKKLNIEYDS